MKNPYKIGTFAAVLGVTLVAPSQSLFAANTNALPTISKKYDPSRCYWLEAKITAEGLCGEKMRPDMPLIIKEAEEGNILAAYRLGQLYTSGAWGVEEDIQQGVEWYRRSAEGGFRLSQIKLGFMYEHGRGIEPDLVRAVYWYEQAIEHGMYPDLEDKVLRLREQLESPK